MDNVLQFHKKQDNDDGLDDWCFEGITADVAIAPDGQVSIIGEGAVDFYSMDNGIGVTVTASTGLQVFVSLNKSDSLALIRWLSNGEKPDKAA